MNNTLLGGLLALGGVFLGGLVSLAVEALRHNWAVSDREYERRKEIVDRRCDHAESYAQAVTGDFRSIMRDAEAYLLSDDPGDAARRHVARLYWKDHLDTKVFSLGPSIHALSDEGLVKSWDHMMKALDKLHQLYGQAWKFKFEGKSLSSDDPIGELNITWSDFARNLGDFYKRLDEMRLELTKGGSE